MTPGVVVRVLALIFVVAVMAGFGSDEETARALVERARAVVDIRSVNAQPFTLRMDLKVFERDGITEGEYLLHWFSSEKWRDEIRLGDSTETRVTAGGNLWTVSGEPSVAYSRLLLQSAVFRSVPVALGRGVRHVSAASLNGAAATCVELIANQRRSSMCFERDTGVLLKSTYEESVTEYGDYANFAGKLVPGLVRIAGAGAPAIEARLVEVVTLSSIPAGLFEPPGGAEVRCQNLTYAQLVRRREPEYPRGVARGQSAMIAIIANVGTDGKVSAAHVVQSTSAEFASVALDAVREWEFTPASCAGAPVAAPVNIEITIRSF